MAELTTSGGIIILAPGYLVVENILSSQAKANSFRVRKVDTFEVV